MRLQSSAPRRRERRRTQTDTERRLWYLLRARQPSGFKFRRQHAVGPFVLDFYCAKRRLAVEVDGGQHADAGGLARDDRRTAYLARRGVRVVRFSDRDVLQAPENVVEVLIGLLESDPPDALAGR